MNLISDIDYYRSVLELKSNPQSNNEYLRIHLKITGTNFDKTSVEYDFEFSVIKTCAAQISC